MNKSDIIDRKFIDEIDITEWEIETDSGWHDITSIKQTIEYEVWILKTKSGLEIKAADTHILFDEEYNEIFINECVPHETKIITKNGLDVVIEVYNTNKSDNMYDITVNSDDHRYYTNDILSHNTTCAAGFLLWRAMFTPDSTILVAAHQYSGASEIMQRVRYAYEEFPDFLRAGVMEYNKGTITFDNGSRILSSATTEKTGRGLALSLIYLDEFAFVDTRIAQEFWTALAPTLSTGGDCIITSTPNSETDQFAEIWQDANNIYDEFGNFRPDGLGVNDFKAYTIDWKEVPRPENHEEFERKMRAQLGEDRWLREFLCQFISFEETLINGVILKGLKGIDPIRTAGRVRWYDQVLPNRMYIIGLDPSMGTGGDNAAITVWRVPDMVQIAEWKHNKSDTKEQIRVLIDILVDIHRELRSNPDQQGRPEIYWSVENNTLGEAALQIIDATGEDKFPGEFVHEPKKKRKGFTTTQKNKIESCVRLKHLVENKKLKVNSLPLVMELKSFVKNNRSYEAKVGQTDDLVSSALLCMRILTEVQNWDASTYDELADIIDINEEGIDPMPGIFV